MKVEIDGIVYKLDTKTLTASVENAVDVEGDVVLPSFVEHQEMLYCVKNIKSAAFFRSQNLTSIVIPEGVESFGYASFKDCSNLVSITLPNSLCSIGERAFVGCVSLTSITIPSKVTYIGDEAFEYCYSLESLVVDDGNPKYDSREGCNAIIKTSTNTLIVGCKSTIIPDSITTLGISAFGGCSDLTSIKIPNSIVRIERFAFKDCDNLREVTIPEGVKFIGDHCFYECRLLSSITIPSSVVKISPLMTELTSLTSIVVEKENPKYDSRGGCNAIIQTSSNTLLVGCKTTIIPNDVKCIGHSAFADVEGLKSITIPNGVKKIEAFAFFGTDLKEIIISKSVKKIGDYSFFDCAKLNTIIYEGTIQQWKKIEKGEGWDLDSPIKIICCIDGDIPHLLNLDFNK